MPTYQDDPVISRNTKKSDFEGGIYGESTLFNGVRSVTYAPGHGAVVGVNSNNNDNPNNPAGPGVYGTSKGNGVWGDSETWMGVYGNSKSTTGGAGVMGESSTGEGVRGFSHSAHGGVVGINDWAPAAPPGAGGNGGWFESTQGEGVRGWSKNPNHGGVVGVNTAKGIGVYGNSDDGHGVFGTVNSSLAPGHARGFGDPNIRAGVCGENLGQGYGLKGTSNTIGIFGKGEIGVVGFGSGPNGTGVFGDGDKMGAELAGGHAGIEVSGK